MIAFALTFIFGLLLGFLRLMTDPAGEPPVIRKAPIASSPVPSRTPSFAPPPSFPNANPQPPLETKFEEPEIAEPKAESKESDAELLGRLKRTNLNGPLKGQQLDDLDALYERIGGYVDPADLQEILKTNPKDLTELNRMVRENEADNWADAKEMMEFNQREREIAESLNGVDLKGPLSNSDVQNLWELQDLYGFDLSPQQMREVLESKPGNIDEFIERASEVEEQFAGR